ncbi:MSHA biogenesis protein MshN [Aliiglaciecola lipolytica E3]|uniref:MSHA biogenesis protein MshN n=2 Tax=Aliiglaciecola TaxID=1406885 RepID=K6YAX6_9ALTE|nr:MSHA biogenesis protein MshN [Aliiglaciecola lipolytica E3]
MSVVNKMLQDLEDRKAKPDYSADYQPENGKKVSLRSIYILLVVLLFAGAVWFYKDALWLYNNSSNQVEEFVVSTEKPQLQPESKIEKDNNIESSQVNTSKLEVSSELAKYDQKPISDENANTQVPRDLQDINQQKQTLQPADTELVQAVEQNQQRADSENNLGLKNEAQIDNNVPAFKQVTSKQALQLDSEEGSFEIKSSDKPLNKDELKQQVQLALKRGDEQSAIKLLNQLVNVTPENTSARKRLAAMLFAQGNHSRANEVLERGIILYPGNVELRIMQAKLYEQAKKPMQGFELLLSHPVSAYQSPDYIAYRAALAQKVERFEQAKLDYQQLVKSQSANAKWWLGLAVVEERLGNMVAALDAYQHVKQLSQMSVEVEEFVEQRIRYLAEVK